MAAKPWDRRPDESGKAFEAFSVYIQLGTTRTLDAVAKQLKKSATIMGRWSSAYSWVSRAADYDSWVDLEARKKLDREAIKRKADMLRRHAETGRALQSFGIRHIQTAQQAAKGADAINAIKTGVELERKSEGLPDYLLEVMEATDDDLTRAYNDLIAQIGGITSGDEEAGD